MTTTKKFNLTVQADCIYVGRRSWKGSEMHNSWSVDNMDENQRGEWTVSTTAGFEGWLQFRGLKNAYCMRYNTYDLQITETDLETVLSPGSAERNEIGVMFKYTNKNSFYFLSYNGGFFNWGDKNLRLYKKQGTNYRILAEIPFPVFDRTKKYKVKIYSKDGLIQIWMDDVLVFDIVDTTSPYTRGAFGPITKGQDFARWEYIKAISNSTFIANRRETDIAVESEYHSPISAKRISPDTVGKYMEGPILIALAGLTYTSYNVNRYLISSDNSRIYPVFNRTKDQRTTSDSEAIIYAYQEPPSKPPTVVTTLKGVALSESEIKLTWSHDGVDTDGFHILDEKGQVIKTVPSDTREMIEEGLAEYTTYTRYLAPYNVAGVAGQSNAVTVTTWAKLPIAPSYLVGKALNHHSIEWSWDDNSYNEDGFDIIDFSTGTIRVVGAVGKDINKYVETGLQPETTYYRYLRARNSRGVSELSNEANATTTELLPDPPKNTPYNFKGVGVAHDVIMWTWIDTNTDADGFVFFDKNDKEVVRIPYMEMYNESGLMSSMEYGRKIAAYNRGGVGPMTGIVYAKTLPYGYDRQEMPLPAFNLQASDITQTTALLTWEYEENPLLPYLGFIVYGDNDVPLGRTERDQFTLRITEFQPGQYYRVYVVAYNDNGESMKSNIVGISTLPLAIEDDGHTNEPEDGFVDNLDGVEYDYEKEETPKIEAFASGVGDRFDLLVQSDEKLHRPLESLSFISRIRAMYEEEETYLPFVDASVQLRLKTINSKNETITINGDVIKTTLQAGDNPIKFNEVLTLDNLPQGIRPLPTDYSIQVCDENGVPVKSGENNIFYIMDTQQTETNVGFVEQVDMSNVFGSWHKFSHNGKTQQVIPPGDGFWQYDPIAGAIKTTQNVERFTGTVSPDYYDNYDFKAHIYSTANDNDCMVLVLAFTTDALGKEHTLSAVRRRDKADIWTVWYNFEQTNAMIVAKKDGFDSWGASNNWSQFGTTGTTIHAKRAGDRIEVKTTRGGSKDIIDSTLLSFTLNDHPVLEMFKGAKPIGVGAKSQANTYLRIEEFGGEKTEVKHFVHVHMWTDKSDTRTVYKEWFGREEVSSGYVIEGYDKQEIVAKVQSPYYQADWQAMNEIRKFVEGSYSISISSMNPNVYLEFVDVPKGFSPSDSVYMTFRVSAQIINVEQTPWHPQIHNGFYYLNHREHFLYSETDVRAELNSDIEVLEYSFPYDIDVDLATNHEGGLVHVTHKTSDEFLRGTFDSNVIIPLVSDYMTMVVGNTPAIYESPIVTFIDDILDWSSSHVVGDNHEQVDIEVAELDAFDNVIAWHPIDTAPAISRTKYRLTLNPSAVPVYNQSTQALSTDALMNSYLTNIDINNYNIQIKDPENNSAGIIVTRPFSYSQTVHSLDEISLEMDLPENATVQLYTVTADSFTHSFHLPSASHPWVPANLISKNGRTYKFKPSSVPNHYVSVIAEITVGDNNQSPIIHDMQLEVTTEVITTEVPIVYEIHVGGEMRQGFRSTKYTVPMIGTLISNMAWQPLTEYSVSEVVSRYMKEKGYVLSESTTIKEYLYTVDPLLPVELEGDYLGANPLLGRTTEEVGEAAYRQKDISVEGGRAIIRPIPQNGKPIVIRNAQGTLMRHVHNLDENFNQTLDFTEFMTIKNSRYLFMKNVHPDIDLRSLHILIFMDDRWVRVYNAVVKQNRIILPTSYEPGLTVKVVYRVKNSYTIDYNHDTDKDYALINVHMDYNEDIAESKVLNVIYETNKVHPYYMATEVNMNPLLGKESKGFLYLTDTVKPAERLDIFAVSNVTSTNHEEIIVHAYLLDEDGNPVVNHTVTVNTDYGKLMMKTMETDENGMVVYKLNVSGVLERTITLTAEALITSKKTLYATKEIAVHRESFGSKIVLEATQREFNPDAPTDIRILTVGENHQRMSGITVELSASHGHVMPSTVITDHEGKFTFAYHHSGNPDDKIISITAENSVNKESIILGMKEV